MFWALMAFTLSFGVYEVLLGHNRCVKRRVDVVEGALCLVCSSSGGFLTTLSLLPQHRRDIVYTTQEEQAMDTAFEQIISKITNSHYAEL